jgi:hypothetical protein
MNAGRCKMNGSSASSPKRTRLRRASAWGGDREVEGLGDERLGVQSGHVPVVAVYHQRHVQGAMGTMHRSIGT